MKRLLCMIGAHDWFGFFIGPFGHWRRCRRCGKEIELSR